MNDLDRIGEQDDKKEQNIMEEGKVKDRKNVCRKGERDDGHVHGASCTLISSMTIYDISAPEEISEQEMLDMEKYKGVQTGSRYKPIQDS